MLKWFSVCIYTGGCQVEGGPCLAGNRPDFGEGERGNMRTAEKVITLVSRYLNFIGMGFLVLLMLLITADVLMRAIWNQPIKGSMEMSELVMVLTIFLALAWVQVERGNIAVDILFDRFPPKVKAVLDVITTALCLGVCGLTLWRSIEFQTYLIDSGRGTNILNIPIYPFQLMIVIGYFMLCLVFILHVADYVRKAVKA